MSRYRALEGYARIVRAVAVLAAAVIGIVGAVSSVVAASDGSIWILLFGLSLTAGIAYLTYVAFGAAGDAAQLLIDVEGHARKVANGGVAESYEQGSAD